MSRKKKKSQPIAYPSLTSLAGKPLPRYQNSVMLNESRYRDYLTWILNIALARFKWLGLPDTIDERFMESLLLWQGCVAFFWGESDQMAGYFATRFTSQEPLNIYDNFTKIRSIGNNGWNYEVAPDQFVVIWENMSRSPMMPAITDYAYKLSDIDRTLDTLRKHAKMPYVITGAEEHKQDMVNLWRQIDSNEPAVIATSELEQLGINAIQTFNPALPQVISVIEDQKVAIMNEILEYLGIAPSEPSKVAQQSLAESNNMTQSISMTRLSALNARRQACDAINAKWGLDVSVVLNSDYISDNFDMAVNQRVATEVAKGADTAGNAGNANGGRPQD